MVATNVHDYKLRELVPEYYEYFYFHYNSNGFKTITNSRNVFLKPFCT